MNRYTSYCTEEQTERAYKLGAPIEILKGCVGMLASAVQPVVKIEDKFAIIPTTQQMIEWLREKGFFIAIDIDNDISHITDDKYYWCSYIFFKTCEKDKERLHKYKFYIFESYIKAAFAAINIVLDNLEKVK